MKKIKDFILEVIVGLIIMEFITILWNLLLDAYNVFGDFIKYVVTGIIIPIIGLYGIYKFLWMMGPEIETGMVDGTILILGIFIAAIWIVAKAKEYKEFLHNKEVA